MQEEEVKEKEEGLGEGGRVQEKEKESKVVRVLRKG